jgi:hypothetical protein
MYWPIAGRLAGILWSDTVVGDTLLSSLVSRQDANALGASTGELMLASIRNVAAHRVRELNVMRVTDQCRLLIFQDNDPSLPSRMFDLEALVGTIYDKLSPQARESVELGPHGALVAVPRTGLMLVFSIDAGDLLTGAVNLAANAHANFDQQDDEALSPWLYWVREGLVDEVRYELDSEGDVEFVNLPSELNGLLR